MPLLGELFANVFEELEASGLFPPDFTWAGGSYKCIPNSEVKSQKLEVGGFAIDEDFVLFARQNQFSGAKPEPGQTISVTRGASSITYRIARTTDLVDQGIIRLGCVNQHRGA